MDEVNPSRCQFLRESERDNSRELQHNQLDRQRKRAEIDQLRRQINPVFSELTRLRALEKAASIGSNAVGALGRSAPAQAFGGALGLTDAALAVRISVLEARHGNLEAELRSFEIHLNSLQAKHANLENDRRMNAAEMRSLNCVLP